MSVKILIVDDEPGMRSLLTRVMEKEGYSASAAGGGDEAIDLLDREEEGSWKIRISSGDHDHRIRHCGIRRRGDETGCI